MRPHHFFTGLSVTLWIRRITPLLATGTGPDLWLINKILAWHWWICNMMATSQELISISGIVSDSLIHLITADFRKYLRADLSHSVSSPLSPFISLCLPLSLDLLSPSPQTYGSLHNRWVCLRRQNKGSYGVMNFVHYQITFLINLNAPLLHLQSASKAKRLSVNVGTQIYIDPPLTTSRGLGCFWRFLLIDKLMKKNGKAFKFPTKFCICLYLFICEGQCTLIN